MRGCVRVLAIAVVLLCVAPLGGARADARTDYLLRVLSTSDQFRVRAQAALALSRVTADDAVVAGLTGALRDAHPAVRGSAVASLEALRASQAVDAIRPLTRDPEAAVRSAAQRAVTALGAAARTTNPTTNPNTNTTVTLGTQGTPRYYVALATPSSVGNAVDAASLQRLRASVVQSVSGIPGVIVAPEGESAAQARQAVTQRRLLGYHVDPAIIALTETGGTTQVRISVTLSTHPSRDMRTIMSARAEARGSGPGIRDQLITAALARALSGLSQALDAAAQRDGNR